MELFIKPLNDDVKAFYFEHGTFHEGDSGLDLFCPDTVVVKARTTMKITLGIACQAVYSKKPSSYYLYPRSSISKTPLRLANSVGIIDQGYTGELMAYLDNVSDKDYVIHRGDRLFQICAPDLKPFKFSLVKTLRTTTRGTGGFGSTG